MKGTAKKQKNQRQEKKKEKKQQDSPTGDYFEKDRSMQVQ